MVSLGLLQFEGDSLEKILSESLPFEITPQQVQQRLQAGEKLCLIDVREIMEFQTARIEGASLVPMGTVPSRLGELEAQAESTTLVVICHHGMRSLNVVNWLRQQGVEQCTSLAGGIDLWSREIDPNVPRY